MNEERFQLLRVIEAVLFAVPEPMAEAAIASHLPADADVGALMNELAGHYGDRGINLVRRDGKWAFRTASDLAGRLRIEVPAIRRLSRAAVETLAIVAYHQPVTRAEIEEIRGVALSRGTLDTLLELGWVRPKGRRQTPGRPVTWATTDAFYDHFGLQGPDALPGIEELRSAGLLEIGSAISALGVREMDEAAPADGAEEAEPLDEEALVEALDIDDEEIEPPAAAKRLA